MLKVRNLSKTYGDVKALDDISFSVQKGKVTGFLGPNGAGKTTTLRIITDFTSPDDGEVLFDKQHLAQDFKGIISQVGYLPEDNPLYKNMRVDEFLTFNAQIKEEADMSDLKDISKTCGITEVLTKEIETLSKGYKQRVGLAKALIGNPKYLILDEPTAGLDPNQKQEILKLIKSLSKDKTILFSSHVLSEVTQIADKVIIINKGKIVAEGNREELVKQYFKNAVIHISTDASYLKLKTELVKVKTVVSIEKISTGKKKFQDFEVLCSEPEKTAMEIFKIIVGNNWQLNQLHTKAQGLEELFGELTK